MGLTDRSTGCLQTRDFDETEETQGPFYRVRKCVVHKEGKVKKLTEKLKKWLVNLHLWLGGSDRIMLMCANG